MNILVIDGQGGQIGGQLIKSLLQHFKDIKSCNYIRFKDFQAILSQYLCFQIA